jgi:5-methylcytosine-specific restriction endonuclease McrA
MPVGKRKLITPRSFVCERCGKDFPNVNWVKVRKFCSKQCMDASERISRQRSEKRMGFQFTEESKRKMSRSHWGQKTTQVGENHHAWKGGISKNKKRDFLSREVLNWRLEVFERDGYQCQDCGKEGNRKYGTKGIGLDACHIKAWKAHPTLRFKVSNGRTLCRRCHIEFDKEQRAKAARCRDPDSSRRKRTT